VLVNGQYQFFNLDTLYDFILSIGMKPIVELSFMPEELASGTETVFHYKGNITPPTDYSQWADLVQALVTHLVSRYGLDEVRTWRFEVWNEPNCGFWYGTQQEYFTLYNWTALAVKSVDSQILVGGPATCQTGWISEFIDFATSNQVPFDFISTHLYPTDPNVPPTPLGFAETIRDACNSLGAAKITVPLVITEFNAGLGLPVLDQSYSPAFLYQQIQSLQVPGDCTLDTLSWWTFTDIFEEGGQDSTPFQNGYGLQNIYGVAKPIYRGFQLLAEFAGDAMINAVVSPTLNNTVMAFATIDSDDSEVSVFLSNFNNWGLPISNYSVVVTFSGNNIQLPALAELRYVDAVNANPSAVWVEMGSPQYPTSDQILKLQEASEVIPLEVPITNQQVSLQLNAYGIAVITFQLN